MFRVMGVQSKSHLSVRFFLCWVIRLPLKGSLRAPNLFIVLRIQVSIPRVFLFCTSSLHVEISWRGKTRQNTYAQINWLGLIAQTSRKFLPVQLSLSCLPAQIHLGRSSKQFKHLKQQTCLFLTSWLHCRILFFWELHFCCTWKKAPVVRLFRWYISGGISAVAGICFAAVKSSTRMMCLLDSLIFY